VAQLRAAGSVARKTSRQAWGLHAKDTPGRLRSLVRQPGTTSQGGPALLEDVPDGPPRALPYGHATDPIRRTGHQQLGGCRVDADQQLAQRLDPAVGPDAASDGAARPLA